MTGADAQLCHDSQVGEKKRRTLGIGKQFQLSGETKLTIVGYLPRSIWASRCQAVVLEITRRTGTERTSNAPPHK